MAFRRKILTCCYYLSFWVTLFSDVRSRFLKREKIRKACKSNLYCNEYSSIATYMCLHSSLQSYLYIKHQLKVKIPQSGLFELDTNQLAQKAEVNILYGIYTHMCIYVDFMLLCVNWVS